MLVVRFKEECIDTLLSFINKKSIMKTLQMSVWFDLTHNTLNLVVLRRFQRFIAYEYNGTFF